MLLLIDKIKERILRYYYKKVFLARIGSKDVENLRIESKVTVNVKPLTLELGSDLRISSNVTFRNAGKIIIGRNVCIYSNVTFGGDGEIVIGDNVDIGNDTIIFSTKEGGVYIGNDVAIAAHCYIIDSDHGIEKNRLIREQKLVSGKIHIGNDVWIADNCTVLKNSIINDGAVIGAKSLVNREIDSYGIAVGIPARVIKYRE